MDDNLPLVTAAITCYNAAPTIERAIKSALDQDWPNLEIIIVDDASTDHSVSIVQSILTRFPNGQLIVHGQNLGVATTRNTLLANAHGEYIVFFDDDDQSHSNRIREQYKKIKQIEAHIGHSTVACYASIRRHYPNKYTPEFQAIGSQGSPVTGAELVAYQLHLPSRSSSCAFWGNGTPALSLMIATDILRDLGGFDKALRRYEDAEMALRLALRGGVFVGCSQVLIEQYSTGGLDKRPNITLESELYIIEKYRDILLTYNQYYFSKLWAYMRYHYYRHNWFMFGAVIFVMGCIHPLKSGQRIFRVGPARLKHESRMR